MITRLYLLRHGIAVPHGTPGMDDDDRPLTARGVAHVKEVARGLKRMGIEPDRVVTSPLPRARRTAEIVAEELRRREPPEHHDVLRPTSSAKAIRDWVDSGDGERVMLVGHDPSLSELIGVCLVGEALPMGLKKGGFAELRREAAGPFRLRVLATPRVLRGASH